MRSVPWPRRKLLQRGDDGDAAPPTLVLPLDQAEELFNADAGQSADRFLGLLRQVLIESNADDLGLIVAATIRTDRYEMLQTHAQMAGVGTELFDELKPMPPTQFKEVIVGPAQRATDGGARLRIAPDLVDRLLADAGAGADTLPMLALTLSRLYADYGSTGELTLAHYEGMGGMRRVVQTEIDEVLSADPQVRARQLQALRWAFIPWLATVNPDSGQPMRRVARMSDLPPDSRPLIDALVAKRLMVKDIRERTPVVEVALESLLRQWDELAGWLREERTDLRDADDLVRNADAWRSSNGNPSWLLEGTRLAEATALANRPGFQQRLVGVHDYLNASHHREAQRREADERRRQAELAAAQERTRHAQEQQAAAERHAATLRKRSRILRAVVAVTAVVAVIAVVGFVQANAAGNEARQQFRQATSQRLLTDGQSMLDGSRTGGDVQALQQLVVGQRLAAQPGTAAMFDAAVATAGLAKLIQIPSEVLCIAVSPDGRLIAAGGDGTVWLWNAETGQAQGAPMTGHDGGVANLVFSPDSSLLLSSGADSTVRVWDVASGQQDGEPLKLRNTKGVRVLHFNAAGNRVLLQDSRGRVLAWDLSRRSAPDQVFAPGIDKVAVSNTANRVATAEGDVIKIWDVATGAQIGGDLAARGEVFSLAFNADGSRLASGGNEKVVQLWDTASAAPVGSPMTDNSAEITALAFAPDGGFLAVAAADGSVRFYDDVTQAPLGAPLQALDGFPRGMAIDSSGNRLIIGGSDQTIRTYAVDTVVPHAGQTTAFSPDGSRMATGGTDGLIRLWNRDTGAVTQIDGRMDGITRIAFLSDGDQMLAADGAGTIQRWDVDTGRPIGAAMAAPGAATFSMAVSSSGERVIGGYMDGTVRLWDIRGARLVRPPWKPGDGAITAVGFLEDEKQVGAVFVTTTAELHVWDVEDGDEVDERALGATVAVAFGPDGRIAGGTLDGSVTFMTGIGGDVVGQQDINGHPDAVLALEYDADGGQAATSGRDGSVRIWDTSTATAIGRPLPKAADPVVSLAFSPDGRTLAAGSANNTIRLWPATATVEDLCARLTTNMSNKQWNEWVSPDIGYVQGCPDLPIAADEIEARMEHRTRDDHLLGEGPKRILALDGGGIRGALTLGYLARMEDILRARHGGDPDVPVVRLFRPDRRNVDRLDHRNGIGDGLRGGRPGRAVPVVGRQSVRQGDAAVRPVRREVPEGAVAGRTGPALR